VTLPRELLHQLVDDLDESEVQFFATLAAHAHQPSGSKSDSEIWRSETAASNTVSSARTPYGYCNQGSNGMSCPIGVGELAKG
jgi:hypothetical protein